MRCTRCDRIVVPQAVGRTPDGLVVFGWCLACLAGTDCELVEVFGPALGAPARSIPMTTKPTRRTDEDPRRRRMVALIAIALSGWAAILTALGAIRMARAGARGPLGDGSAGMLLAGGGVLAMIGLALWLSTRSRTGSEASRRGGKPRVSRPRTGRRWP